MKKYIKLNENNVVEIIFNENEVNRFDNNGNESDDIALSHLKINFGFDTKWKMIDQELNDLKVGYLFLENINKFVSYNPPYPSWTLNYEFGEWESPIKKPNDNEHYYWNEEKKEWILYKNV